MGHDPFATLSNRQSATMTVNGLICRLHMSPQRNQRFEGRKEVAQKLIPTNPRIALNVDEHAGCPDEWRHEGHNVGNFFIPAIIGHDFWLDFTPQESHKYHVAAIVSMQGINALTVKWSKGWGLRQYRENCPEHDTPFRTKNFCHECGHIWVPQNYISTNSRGENGQKLSFWLDGFVPEPGSVIRQFIFTNDEKRGIASQLEPAPNNPIRTYNIGIAMFLSKKPKPSSYQIPWVDKGKRDIFSESQSSKGGSPVSPKVEIGAGARVKQDLGTDPEDVETFWQQDPAAVFYLQYPLVPEAWGIYNQRKINLPADGEGPMAGLRFGDLSTPQ